MRRLGLLVLPCLLACVLKENQIGESGNNVGDDADGGSEDGSSSESGSEGSDDVQGCTLIGCDSAAFVHIIYDGLSAGNYQFQLLQSTDGERPGVDNSVLAAGCSFDVSEGEIVDTDCPFAPPLPVPEDFENQPQDGILHIQFPIVPDAYWILLRPNITICGATPQSEPWCEISDTFIIEYQDVYPNGPECDAGCTQGHWWASIGYGGTECEYLEAEFDFEAEMVRECNDAAECGQVIEGTSCGCTRDWVARNDADLMRFYDLVEEAGTLECDFLPFDSTCDCPEADGFACIDNVCTWNYL